MEALLFAAWPTAYVTSALGLVALLPAVAVVFLAYVVCLLSALQGLAAAVAGGAGGVRRGRREVSADEAEQIGGPLAARPGHPGRLGWAPSTPDEDL